jgi:hypothetical protein
MADAVVSRVQILLKSQYFLAGLKRKRPDLSYSERSTGGVAALPRTAHKSYVTGEAKKRKEIYGNHREKLPFRYLIE